MANTNITPSSGDLNLSDKNPRLMPLAGVLLAVGLAAVISAGSVSITPSRGSIVGTGQTAATKQTGIITPATGALIATGETVAPSRSTIPGTGTLTAAGVQAVIAQAGQILITPPSGNLSLGLRDPITPGTGSLALSGQTAAVASIRPNAGTLALTGSSPIMLAGGGSISITPPTGFLFFGETVGVTVPLGGLSLVGGQPSLLVNAIRPTVTGSLALSGTVSNIEGRTRQPGTGSLVLSGASGLIAKSFIPGTGSLTLTGQFASVTGFTQIVTQTGAANLQGSAPTLSFTSQVVLTPSTGSLAVTGQQPIEDRSISGGTGALVLTGTVSTLSGQSAVPSVGGVAIDGQLAALRLDVFITPVRGSLLATGLASNINGLPPRGGVRFPGGRRRRSRVFVVPDREERT